MDVRKRKYFQSFETIGMGISFSSVPAWHACSSGLNPLDWKHVNKINELIISA